MEPYLLAILIAALLLVAAVAIRTIRFSPRPEKPVAAEPPPDDLDAAFIRLSRLIRYRTVSRPDWKKVDQVAYTGFWDCCREMYPGVYRHCTVYDIGQSARLFHWPGASPENPLVLMSHYDVVPAQPGGWEYPPFSGHIEGDLLWGRGTLDTKSTLHGILEAAERLIREGFRPSADIYFSFSGDEEIIGPSAPAVVDWFRQRSIIPHLVVDEGGGVMNGLFPGLSRPVAGIGVGEKGYVDLEITATRQGGHASAPPRHTAVTDLVKAIRALGRKPMKPRLTGPVAGILDQVGRHMPLYLRIVCANLWAFKPLILRAFALYGGEAAAFVQTTCTPTMLHGSEARNVLPATASAYYNARILPGETIQDVETHFEAALRRCPVTVTRHRAAEPTELSPAEGPAWNRITAAISAVFPEAIITPYLMVAGTDAKHFHAISSNVLRFSPMRFTLEDIRLIHNANERIRKESVGQIIAFYTRLIRES